MIVVERGHCEELAVLLLAEPPELLYGGAGDTAHGAEVEALPDGADVV